MAKKVASRVTAFRVLAGSARHRYRDCSTHSDFIMHPGLARNRVRMEVGHAAVTPALTCKAFSWNAQSRREQHLAFLCGSGPLREIRGCRSVQDVSPVDGIRRRLHPSPVAETPKKKRKKRRFSSRLLAWWPTRVVFEVWLFCAIFIVTLFGPRWAYFWARMGARLVWILAGRLRGTALRNVDLCLPELPLAERTRIARASFRQFGYSFIDYFLVPRYFSGDRGDAFFEGSDRESPYVQWAIEGKAAFVLAAHFGNWEVGTWNVNRFAQQPLIVIAKPFQPLALDERIVRARRTFGSEVHRHKGGAKAYARALRENRLVGVLVDQNGGDFAPVETFFGVPCTWQADFARLAVRGGGRVAAAAVRRVGEEFRFKSMESRLFQYHRETDPMQIVRDYRDYLEKVIREVPEQYFWMHRRFKARKDGWADAYANLGKRLTPEERAKIVDGRK